MRKQFLFMMACLCAMSVWGTDVSLTEDYSKATKQGQKNTTITYAGNSYVWKYRKVRIKEDNLKDGTTQAVWFSRYFNDAATEDSCYIGCESVEGGIKQVDFKWYQANTADENKILCLNIEIDNVRVDSIRVVGGDGSSSYVTADQSYTGNLAIKSNAKFVLLNKSHVGENDYTIANGRICVGPITITPYLRYMQKEVTIGLPNKGYINRNLIDNTGETANIRYSIQDKNDETTLVADIDELTGAITPKVAGTAVVTASWEGVTTTYELTVSASTYLEAFSKSSVNSALDKTGEQSWDNCGDVIPSWKVWEARRKVDIDTILGTYVQGTQIRALANSNCTNGYIKTAAPVEGGIKSATMKWKQYGQAANTSLQLQAYFGGVAAGDASLSHDGNNTNPRTNIWTYNPDFSEIENPSNPVFEIRNVSTRSSGNKNANVVISSITITPWLLYYTKEATLNMRVESAEPTRTYTNQGFINNTTGPSVVSYSIVEKPSGISASINASTGQVTIGDRFQTGDITVQAAWNSVTTKYVLHVLGKTATTASYETAVKKIGLDEDPTNVITVTDGYDGTISYASSRPDVVKVVNNELQVVGVGVTTITATLSETENYGGTTASYTLYVRDENALVEDFSNQSVGGGIVGDNGGDWNGKYPEWINWYAEGAIRHNVADTIWGTTNPDNVKVWIATTAKTATPTAVEKAGELSSKEVVEGGIKHLSFYWKQWASESSRTLRLAVYAGDDEIGVMEKAPDSYGDGEHGAENHEKFLFGVNDVMRSNKILHIKNESFKTTRGTIADDGNSCKSRLIIDDIHITPYLLYTNKKCTLDMRDGTKTYNNMSLIDNTEGGTISYSSSDEDVAKVASDGTVTATGLKGGVVRITATWSDEGAGAYTYYDLTVILKQYTNLETFDNITTATANYSATEISRAGITATWSALIGGFNPGVNSGDAVPNDDNCARFKARYSDKQTDPVPYIQSSTIPGGIKSLKFKCKAGGKETTDNGGDISWDIRVLINGELIETLTDLPLNANGGWTPIEIPDINVAGDFVIRFENHSIVPEEDNYNSTNSNAGNRGRLLIDDIEWEGLPMALEDEADNSTVIENNAGYKRNVMLADRTIRTGGYNTLCLPFAVSEETLQATLPGAKAYEFTNAYLSETNLDIRFNKVDALEAGKPYLITVPADVENPVFESVTIDNVTNNIIEGDNMRFIGSFNQETMDTTGLYVVADKLYRASNIENEEDRTIGACRAYFDVLPGAQAVPRNVRMRIVAGKETATDINNGEWKNGEWSNGRKILRDGQLIIIRGDKEYNAQGQVVK